MIFVDEFCQLNSLRLRIVLWVCDNSGSYSAYILFILFNNCGSPFLSLKPLFSLFELDTAGTLIH